MYENSAKIQSETLHIAYVDDKVDYYVNSCGYFEFRTVDARIERKRPDYYLIYIVDGAGQYYIDNKMIRVTSGNVVLYRPHEIQKYEYLKEDKPKCYWMHFTGNKIENLLNDLNIKGPFIRIGEVKEIEYIFNEMIKTIQIKEDYYEKELIAYFFNCITKIARNRNSENDIYTKRLDLNFSYVIETMNKEYMKQYTIIDFSNMANMSVYGFIHKFKKLMDITPQKYLEEIRMNRAYHLVVQSKEPIKNIAELVGYQDPLYFGKRFKIYFDVSPSKLRKNLED